MGKQKQPARRRAVVCNQTVQVLIAYAIRLYTLIAKI